MITKKAVAGVVLGCVLAAVAVACSSGTTTVVVTPDGAACGTGSESCGGTCTVLARDPENCGACGKKCASGEVCSQGACASACGGGTTKCSAECVDTKTDPRNCGACGTKCGASEVCNAGTCGLSCGSSTKCGQSCVDVQSDRTNCGGCGTTCAAGEICSAGKCMLSCQQGLSLCSVSPSDGGISDASSEGGSSDGGLGSPYCANLQSDNANCGACGVPCTGGKVCSNGTCQSTCVQGQTYCVPDAGIPYCASLQSDAKNCGTCGKACALNEYCNAGTCKSTSNPATYSQAFVGGQTPTTQCTVWQSFVAGLGNAYNGVVVYANNNAGFTCTDPTVANGIASALKNNTAYTATCNGHSWSNCNRYSGELWIDPPSQCSSANCPNPGTMVRPCIGNANWGGVAQNTCGGASQTVSLSFF